MERESDETHQHCRRFPGRVVLFLLLTLIFISCTASAALYEGSVLVIVTDGRTGTGLAGAGVYLDGGYVGVTSGVEGAGTIRINNIAAGSHTLRVTGNGYTSAFLTFSSPDQPVLQVALALDHLVSLNPGNTNARGLSIIFVPSSTNYRTPDDVTITTDGYTGNESHFREDVIRIINDTFDNLGPVTDAPISLPQDYQQRLHFYYYFDPAHPADAFSGCAGTVPQVYWDTVTFSDLTVILYPEYEGWYLNSTDQPIGCYEDEGPGHKLMKIPANEEALAYHEMGHGLFGLVDTYCGDTDYFENDPDPNVWASSNACTNGTASEGLDPSACRQIVQDAGANMLCSKNFWRWDPDPDIMRTGETGTFGAASTKRISWILNQSGALMS